MPGHVSQFEATLNLYNLKDNELLRGKSEVNGTKMTKTWLII